MQPIYTSEPMLTRALAAEIRHDPRRFTTMLEHSAGVMAGQWGDFTSVTCESDERLDILLTYSKARVGVEAKLDHEVTAGQLEREAKAVDILMLLVLQQDDVAPQTRTLMDNIRIITWEQALNCLSQPRVTYDDVYSIPITKRKIERQLNRLLQRSTPNWSQTIERGGGGMPSISIQGPVLENGRRLRGQVQMAGRSSRQDEDQIRFEYHVGISVELSDEDFPQDPTVRTTWLDALDALSEIIDQEGDRWSLRRNMPTNGRSEFGRRKMPLVKQHLQGREWLAAGYCDWALGPKSRLAPIEQIEGLHQEALELFAAWHSQISKST